MSANAENKFIDYLNESKSYVEYSLIQNGNQICQQLTDLPFRVFAEFWCPWCFLFKGLRNYHEITYIRSSLCHHWHMIWLLSMVLSTFCLQCQNSCSKAKFKQKITIKLTYKFILNKPEVGLPNNCQHQVTSDVSKGFWFLYSTNFGRLWLTRDCRPHRSESLVPRGSWTLLFVNFLFHKRSCSMFELLNKGVSLSFESLICNINSNSNTLLNLITGAMHTSTWHLNDNTMSINVHILTD